MPDPFWTKVGEALAPSAIGLAGWAAAGFTVWVQRKRKKRPHKPMEVMTRADLEISVLLEGILDRWPDNAKRAYVAQYSNGDAYLGGPDIIRKNRTHERVRPGVSYQQDVYKGVLTSTLPEESEIVLEPGPGFRVVADMKPSSKFRWLCEQAGVVAVARVALLDRQGRPVGFVGVDFDSPVRPPDLDTLLADAVGVSNILRELAA